MSQTTTPSGAEILGALDNAIRPLNRPRKQSEFNELFKARAAVAARRLTCPLSGAADVYSKCETDQPTEGLPMN